MTFSRQGAQGGARIRHIPAAAGGEPDAPADVSAGVAASRIVGWGNIEQVMNADDTALDNYADNRHYGGLLGYEGFVRNHGGDRRWTSDSTATFDAGDSRNTAEWTNQKAVFDNDLVARCHTRGLWLGLGAYANDNDNGTTPFEAWHDNAAWTALVDETPEDGTGFYSIVAALGWMGMDLFSLDGEGYSGAAASTWSWEYTDNPNNEATTRALVKQRGAEFATCALNAWQGPGGREDPLLIVFYTGHTVPHTYSELVQWAINEATQESMATTVFPDFVAGMASVSPGDLIVVVTHSTLQKTQHAAEELIGMSWDAACQYNSAAWAARASQIIDAADWLVARRNHGSTPMIWIDRGESELPFGEIMAQSTYATASLAARRNATHGFQILYAHRLNDTHVDVADTVLYSVYNDESAATADTTAPDTTLPSVTVTTATDNGNGTCTFAGTANHVIGVKAVEVYKWNGSAWALVAAPSFTWDGYFTVETGGYDDIPVDWSTTVSGDGDDWFAVGALTLIDQFHAEVVQAA
jgi:hypothetical protein